MALAVLKRPLSRRVRLSPGLRDYVVTIHQDGVVVRLFRRRTRYFVAWADVRRLGAQLDMFGPRSR
jgi:hypothetical protein